MNMHHSGLLRCGEMNLSSTAMLKPPATAKAYMLVHYTVHQHSHTVTWIYLAQAEWHSWIVQAATLKNATKCPL